MLRTRNRSNRRKCDRVAFPQCSGLDCAAQRTSRIHASACRESTVSQCVIEGVHGFPRGAASAGATEGLCWRRAVRGGRLRLRAARSQERRSRSRPPNSPPAPRDRDRPSACTLISWAYEGFLASEFWAEFLESAAIRTLLRLAGRRDQCSCRRRLTPLGLLGSRSSAVLRATSTMRIRKGRPLSRRAAFSMSTLGYPAQCPTSWRRRSLTNDRARIKGPESTFQWDIVDSCAT
jgi:hypothetical protein